MAANRRFWITGSLCPCGPKSLQMNLPSTPEATAEMPFKSEKQRKYMHAKHPKIAERWERKYGGKKAQGKRSKKSV